MKFLTLLNEMLREILKVAASHQIKKKKGCHIDPI